MDKLLQAITQHDSKMAEAISFLHHLAAEASRMDEPCARILFQAADYLEDVLMCAPENAAESDPRDNNSAANDNAEWPLSAFDDMLLPAHL